MGKKSKLKANAIAKDREKASRGNKMSQPKYGSYRKEGRHCKKGNPSFGGTSSHGIIGIDC